ncbi:MAG: integration host factor subunit beta [Erythrobacter sp.]|uniref:integration host factor subunit beta n=1 Tax=Qipengyuania TaxID=1855416 RepID=UPI0021E57477|nr:MULTISPECIES: integration host factor subunit beta [Qipengyuania]MDE0901889.1 integration host factor subunit beta [Erythrobacter sp.]UYH56302.1 integration host factor subunit beta [Qipengyuania sp. SS22]
MPQPADWNRARKHDFGGARGNNPFVAEWARRRQMIRSELLAALAQDNPELRAEEVEQVVDVFFEEIAQRLSEGGRVELRGFGAFSTREREARKGRNPRTGETVDVPAKRVPYFKPGKDMRRRLNDD